jgi:hypothetical protein
MAIINIELLNIGNISDENISNSIRLINKHQDAFHFSYLDNCSVDFKNEKVINSLFIYDYIGKYLQSRKGFHPYIIGLTDLQLNGEKFSNLFGSMQENEGKLTGYSVMSTFEINRILVDKPIEIYLVFEMLSFAIRFIYGKGLIHDRIEYCIFDKKINKNDLIAIFENIHFCDSCRNLLYSMVLDKDQIISIENILSLINKAYIAENSQAELQKEIKATQRIYPKVFLSHSSVDKPLVEQIAKIMVRNNINVWFDKWEIKFGDNIVQRINDGLNETDYFALIISSNSIKSGWVINEYSSVIASFNQSNKPRIVPILIDSCEIPPLIRALKYIDLRMSDTFEYNLLIFCNEILE